VHARQARLGSTISELTIDFWGNYGATKYDFLSIDAKISDLLGAVRLVRPRIGCVRHVCATFVVDVQIDYVVSASHAERSVASKVRSHPVPGHAQRKPRTLRLSAAKASQFLVRADERAHAPSLSRQALRCHTLLSVFP